MTCKGFEDEKEVAKLFGLSAPDLSQRKKRGSVLPHIIDWAINENVNLNWLLTGEEKEESARISPRSAALINNFEALNEEDKRAFERMALTLAECQKITKKAA